MAAKWVRKMGMCVKRTPSAGRYAYRVQVFAIVTSMCAAVHGGVTSFGPLPYTSIHDSPFDLSGAGSQFFLEDFEDGSLDLPPNVSAGCCLEIRSPGPLTDSVDADDGSIDGDGRGGHSLTSTRMTVLPTNPLSYETLLGPFDFAFADPSQLPTSVGFVLTDAIYRSGLIIGVLDEAGVNWRFEFVNLMDQQYDGGTTEDLFFGITGDVGIRRMGMYMFGSTADDFQRSEFDHFQFGRMIPEPIVEIREIWMLAAFICGRRRAPPIDRNPN